LNTYAWETTLSATVERTVSSTPPARKTTKSTGERAILQLHLEPHQPIEIEKLTGTLASISHQYEVFERRHHHGGGTRIMVAEVAPGSIDIKFILDHIHIAAGLLLPMVSDIKTVTDFAESVKALLKWFSGSFEPTTDPDPTIRDCNDAINFVKPTATHGGTQTINVHHGDVINNIVNINGDEARKIIENAAFEKARLQLPASERKQRVSMIWKRLDRDPATAKGTTPDKALIEEIDPKPKPVFFDDQLSYLKDDMIKSEDKPFQKVYFVDVDVSRVSDKVTAYRIVGYHGNDLLDNGEPDLDL
jgi:hypothetical protein